MNLDNARAFDVLADDHIRQGVRPIPCSVLDNGDIGMGGARNAMQAGHHAFVRVEKRLIPVDFTFGKTINLIKAGSGIIKEINSEGDFWALTVTFSAVRPK